MSGRAELSETSVFLLVKRRRRCYNALDKM